MEGNEFPGRQLPLLGVADARAHRRGRARHGAQRFQDRKSHAHSTRPLQGRRSRARLRRSAGSSGYEHTVPEPPAQQSSNHLPLWRVASPHSASHRFTCTNAVRCLDSDCVSPCRDTDDVSIRTPSRLPCPHPADHAVTGRDRHAVREVPRARPRRRQGPTQCHGHRAATLTPPDTDEVTPGLWSESWAITCPHTPLGLRWTGQPSSSSERFDDRQPVGAWGA